MTSRIASGIGYDIHPLVEGTGIWLGGVHIPCPYHLVGHSDADALIHAICDALLGAVSAGDIGEHFPPSDPQWANAPSQKFLTHVCDIVREKGGLIQHVDTTIITEVPRLTPYKATMVQTLSHIMKIQINQINIKATTSEKMGCIGRKEGLAALAIATVGID